MTLFALHLLSILEPEPQDTMPQQSIPDLVDEQREYELLTNAEEIIARHRGDFAAQIHVNAFTRAARLIEICRARRKDFEARMMDETPDGLEALRDINHAEQLAAHHLDMLDRMGGTPALN